MGDEPWAGAVRFPVALMTPGAARRVDRLVGIVIVNEPAEPDPRRDEVRHRQIVLPGS